MGKGRFPYQSPGSDVTPKLARPKFGVQFRNFDSSLDTDVIEKMGEVGKECERLSYDSLWMIDHLAMRPPIAFESQPIPDCWTAISYLSEVTSKIKVGSLVTCVLLREESYLARLCTTADRVSAGRLVVGIGSGWFKEEFCSYGLPFPDIRERSDALERTAAYLRDYFQSRNSRIPSIWIGGSGESRTLKTVARYGDACSLFGDPVTVARKIKQLKDHRKSVFGGSNSQRPFICSKHSNVVIGRDEREVDRKLAKIIPVQAKWPMFVENNIVGTGDACMKQVRRFMAAGVDYFTLSFPDLFEIESLRSFDEEIIQTFDQEIFA